MKQESLVIRNFGPIADVELHDIKPLTIIIGPSGVGKSTILKVLSLFRWLYKKQNIRSYLKLAGLRRSPFNYVFKSYVKNNGWKGFLKKDTYIRYTYGSYVLEYTDNKLQKPAIIKSHSDLHLEKISFIADSRIIIPDILAGKARTDDFYTLETYKDFKTALDVLQEVSLPYMGVCLSLKKISGRREYRVEGEGQHSFSINLSDSSSGTQTLLPLVAIIRYYASHFDIVKTMNKAILSYLSDDDRLSELRFVKNVGDIPSKRVSLMIEEPELSLSPSKQISLLNELCKNCFTKQHNGYRMSVMLTTHSPYIVNQLNLLTLAHSKGKLIEGASISYEDIEVLRMMEDGHTISLKAQNKEFVDAMSLSDDILKIYTKYDELHDKPREVD